MNRIPLRAYRLPPLRSLSYSNRLQTLSSTSRLKCITKLNSKDDLLNKVKHVYIANNINFLEEFIDNYTPQYKDFVWRLKLKEMTRYLSQDLIDLILRGEYKKVEALEDLLGFQTNRKCMIHRLIQELIDNNQVSIALESVVKLIQSGVTVQYDIIKTLSDSLQYSDDSEFARVSYATLQLYNHYDDIHVNELVNILEFLTSSIHGNYFANYIYQDLETSGKLKNFTPQRYNETIYRLLKVNLINKNAYKCLEIWNAHKDSIAINQNLSLLLGIIKLCQECRIDVLDIIERLPANETQVINYKIEYYGESNASKPQFQETIKQITTLERSTMTSLLSTFLNFGDEENSDKVIQTIFKSSSGINKFEVDLIVQKLLKQDKFEEGIKMIEEMSWYDSQLAYVSLFKYVLENQDQMQGESELFWNDLRSRMKDGHTEEVSKQFTIEILRYITKKDSRDGIRNYVKFINFSNSTITSDYMYLDLMLNTYGIPSWMKRYIRLEDKQTMLDICFMMVPYILEKKSYWNTVWIFNEFRKLGWDLPSIFQLFKTYDQSDYLSSIFKQKILNSISTKSSFT